MRTARASKANKRVTAETLTDDFLVIERIWKRLDPMRQQYRPWKDREGTALHGLYQKVIVAEVALKELADAVFTAQRIMARNETEAAESQPVGPTEGVDENSTS